MGGRDGKEPGSTLSRPYRPYRLYFFFMTRCTARSPGTRSATS